MATSLILAMLPLWAASSLIVSGKRYQLGVLGFLSIWTVASVAWGHIVPRLTAWDHVFTIAVWVTVFVCIWLVVQPSRGLLRRRLTSVTVITVGFTVLIVGVSAVPITALIQMLGWGHDNSAFIFLARANTDCGGLLATCSVTPEAVPSYLIEYPQGLSVSWASLPGAFAGSSFLDSLHVYAALYLLTSLVLVLVISWFAVSLARNSTWAWAAGMLTGLTVALGVWSHQFWSGFASFLWTIVVIVAFLILRESQILSSDRLWFVFAAISLIAVYYSHQLLFPFLFVYVMVDGFVHRRPLLNAFRKSPLFLVGAALVSLALALSAPRTAQGNSFIDQVVAVGGAEALPLWVWIPLCIVGGFILFARGTTDRVALRWSMLTGGLMFGALALLTIRVNGYISYYPMKFLTFLVLILIACSAAVVVHKPLQTRAHQAWFTLGGLAVLALAVLPPLLRYPGFKTAYQGSTPTVLRTLATDLYGGGVGLCAQFVLRASDGLPNTVGRVEVYRGGRLQPLESRWINLIRGQWDTQAWLNEVDWRPMSDIPPDTTPDAVITHDGIGESPSDVLRLDLGELCDREQLPAVLPIG